MVNQIISAARYNFLQGQIESILGRGSGDKGYNQAVQSSSVPTSETVFASHMNNLYSDFSKVYAHQTGFLPPSVEQVDNTDDITEALHAAYESLINTVTTNRFEVATTQYDEENAGITSTRTTVWGGSATPQTVTHEFTVSFTDVHARRGFFNAGGRIIFDFELTSSASGDDVNKTQDWVDMLDALTSPYFDYTETNTNSGPGTGSLIGNFDLTNSYQVIFRKTGSGVYIDNEVVIEAKQNSDSQIQFLISFNDDANGAGGADERVVGTLESRISQRRATGVYVESPSPTYRNVSTLG